MSYLLNLHENITYLKDLIDQYKRLFPGENISSLTDKEITRILIEVVKKLTPIEVLGINDNVNMGMGFAYNEEKLYLVDAILNGTVTIKDVIESVNESPDCLTGVELFPVNYEGDECIYSAVDYWLRTMNGWSRNADDEDDDGFGFNDDQDFDFLFTDDKTTVINLITNEGTATFTGPMPLGPLLAITINPFIYMGDGLPKEYVQEAPLASLIETMFDIVNSKELDVDNNPFLAEYERSGSNTFPIFFEWKDMEKLKTIFQFSEKVYTNLPEDGLVNKSSWLINQVLQLFWLSPIIRNKISEEKQNGR